MPTQSVLSDRSPPTGWAAVILCLLTSAAQDLYSGSDLPRTPAACTCGPGGPLDPNGREPMPREPWMDRLYLAGMIGPFIIVPLAYWVR